MIIPKIRKLPSGSYFCQLRIDGQSISITDDDPDVVYAKAAAYRQECYNPQSEPEQSGVMRLKSRTAQSIIKGGI